MSPAAIALPLSEAVCFSPDGSLLAVSVEYSGMVLRIEREEMRGGIITRIEPGHCAIEFAFSPDGRTLATRFEGIDEIALAHREGDRFVAGRRWKSKGFHMKFSPCGKFLVTGHDWGLRVLDVETGHCEFDYRPKSKSLAALECSAARDVWITAHAATGKKGDAKPAEFRRWTWPFDTATSEVLPYAPTFLDQVALSPNGELLAVVFCAPHENDGTFDGTATLQVYSLARQMILHEQPGYADQSFSSVLQWAPDNRCLGHLTRDGVAFLDFKQRKELASVALNAPAKMDFSPDGEICAVTGQPGAVFPLGFSAR